MVIFACQVRVRACITVSNAQRTCVVPATSLPATDKQHYQRLCRPRCKRLVDFEAATLFLEPLSLLVQLCKLALHLLHERGQRVKFGLCVNRVQPGAVALVDRQQRALAA